MSSYRLPRNVLASAVGLMCFLTIGGGVTILAAMHGKPPRPAVVLLVAYGGGVLLGWYATLTKTITRIEVQENNRIVFYSVLKKTMVTPERISAITVFPRRFMDDTAAVILQHEKGETELHWQMEGLEEFLSFLKTKNPRILVTER